MSDILTFTKRLELFKFNYETYKLAYNNNRYDLCKKLFNNEMLHFLNNTSYELIDSILVRIILFEDLKLSKKTLYDSFNTISIEPLLYYLYNDKENKKLKESKSMPEFTFSKNNNINSLLSNDTNSISSNSLDDRYDISSTNIFDLNNIKENSKSEIPKVKKNIIMSLFGF